MNKNTFLFSLLALCGALVSCEDSFDLFDDFSGKTPVVVTDSVFMYAQDTMVVVGHIESKGGAPIEVAGFCYDTRPNPSVLSNQVAYGNVDRSFAALVTGLQEDSTYYFSTFAANSYGSTRGNEVSYTVPSSAPPVVPCTLPDGSITDNGYTYPVTYLSAGTPYALYTSVYGILAGITTISGRCDYYIGFTTLPTTGVYTVSSYGHEHNDKRSVMMQIRYSSSRYSITDGGKVYVEELGKGSGKYKVTFCNLQYQAFSSTFNCMGSFTTN